MLPLTFRRQLNLKLIVWPSFNDGLKQKTIALITSDISALALVRHNVGFRQFKSLVVEYVSE